MPSAAIRRFWDWFAARAGAVREFRQENFDEISDMVQRMDPGLGWEMGGSQEGPMTFIIRSEDPELRHLAHRVIAAAPTLEGWSFSAWRGAAGTGFELDLGDGRKFTMDNATFEVSDHPTLPFLELTMVAPAFSKMENDQRLEAGYLTLDCLLGEKLVEDSLDRVDFRGGDTGSIRATRLKAHVEKRLAALRKRRSPSNDQWKMLKAETPEGPLFAMVADAPGTARMAANPWRIEHAIRLKGATEHGLPSGEELKAMQPFEDEAEEAVKSGGGVHVATVTHQGEREFDYYYPDVDDVADRLAAVALRHQLNGTVKVIYDPRWRGFRQFQSEE